MEYKVKSLYVNGRKRVFKSGEIVIAKDFEPGMVDQLVKDGYLIPHTPEAAAANSTEDTQNTLFDQSESNDNGSEETATEETETEVEETAAEENTGEKPVDFSSELADKTYKDFNKDELIEMAKLAGIFDSLPSKATKSEIFDALKAL